MLWHSGLQNGSFRFWKITRWPLYQSYQCNDLVKPAKRCQRPGKNIPCHFCQPLVFTSPRMAAPPITRKQGINTLHRVAFLFAVLFSILSLSDLKSALSFLEFFLILIITAISVPTLFLSKKALFPLLLSIFSWNFSSYVHNHFA